jgi:hypothetical protein
MFAFLLGILCFLGAVVLGVFGSTFIYVRWLRVLAIGMCCLLGIVFCIWSSTLWIGPSKGGLVTKKFGVPLKEGHIVAAAGERGVQADIISPGWSFGPADNSSWLWWPWLYDVESVDNITIPEGNVGVVVALDGAPLPEGEIYAPAWDDPTRMIDAKMFLVGHGCKGPQLTVLPPGQYRYNPKLFEVRPASCVDVPIGYVGVVRANAGLTQTNILTDVVNGVPLVPKGYRGIWKEPLLPAKYYLHPNAYQVIQVKVTKRVYSYTSASGSEANTSNKKEPEGDNSIHVRSSDSFQFPVDVRVAVAILAENAPYVVAKIGDPDSRAEKGGFDLLEERVILPSLRAILRNSAEKKKALEYVNSRSQVETDAMKLFQADLLKDKVETEGFFLADIGLNRTPEGQQLLKTQTDTEIALQQQAQYKEQVKAEDQRAQKVKAQEAADQQKNIQESLAKITVEDNNARAAENKARGDAAQSLVYEAKVKALGGTENFTRLEVTKMWAEALGRTWKGDLPHTMFVGGQGGTLDSVMTAVFSQQLQGANPAPAPKK